MTTIMPGCGLVIPRTNELPDFKIKHKTTNQNKKMCRVSARRLSIYNFA
jgi:hypothetical protein